MLFSRGQASSWTKLCLTEKKPIFYAMLAFCKLVYKAKVYEQVKGFKPLKLF
jgi:hypothetical protein